MGFRLCAVAAVEDEVHCEVVDVSLEIPDLEDDVAAFRAVAGAVGFDESLAAFFSVVVADCEDAGAAGGRALKEAAECLQDLVVAEQMGDRVVAGDHRVELPGVVRVDLAHVADGEVQLDAAAVCLSSGPFDLARREVGTGHAETSLRQAEGLRADAAGDVEKRGARLDAPPVFENGGELLGLPGDAGVPVLVDEVIQRADIVVMSGHRREYQAAKDSQF